MLGREHGQCGESDHGLAAESKIVPSPVHIGANMALALLLMSALLAAIAIVSIRYQLRNWRRLRSESLASDDRRYLRGVCQRRTLNAVLLLALAGLLAGAYLSG